MTRFLSRSSMLLWVALVGCSSPPAVDETTAAIIGGSVDNGDPSVVAIYARQPGATQGALCTASVIGPRTLLTAAHCVDPAEVGAGAVFEARFGTDFRNPSRIVAVSEVHHDPLFSAQNLGGGHDIGVAILAEPANVPAVPYLRSTISQSLVGKPIRLVGYGLDNGFSQTGAGTKRQATTQLVSISPVVLEIGDFSHKTCSGDSGGPAFATIDGVETLVGVTSYGFIFCLGNGFDTRVDLYGSFISQYLQ